MRLGGQKIKSRLKKDGYFINLIFKTKDYLAAWIANLGVVPLFLLEAFLFAPAFFFFLNLLFVVTHVLETICKLPSSYKSNYSLFNNFNKPTFLPMKSSCVKGIVISICSILPITTLFAKTVSHDLILARGQSQEIQLPQMEKFNVGNRQVITYRLNEKSKNLLIRGTTLGHSEVLVWNRDKSLETYQVFVISKNQEAKLMHLAETVAGLGLDSQMVIPHLKVSGVIKTLSQYKNYQKLMAQYSEVLMDEVELDQRLINSIYSGVYSAFFEDYKDSIKCQSEFSKIICFYPENEAPSESLKKYLNDKYNLSLVQKNNQQFHKNYRLKIKLIQLEQLDGEDLRLGLEQVSGSLSDFFTLPIEKIIQKNQVLLAQKNMRLSTLAEPIALLRPLTPAEMQIGADIPFKNQNPNNTQSTDWKFAGLKIKVTLENFGEKVKINYETELTQPSSDSTGSTSIGGNKEKSSVVISLNKAVKIFQLSLKTEGKSTDQMPFLNAIPILGELFKSRSSQNNYKTITGIIEVEQNEE